MSIINRSMESHLMQRTVLAWRWWVLVGQVVSAALAAADIITLALVNAKCPALKTEHPSESYMLLGVWDVLPWIAAAAIQKIFMERQSLWLDIWRVLTLPPIYVSAFIISIPFLEDFFGQAIKASPECLMDADGHFTSRLELYLHLDLMHILPAFLLMAALVVSFVIAGCVRVVSRLTTHQP